MLLSQSFNFSRYLKIVQDNYNQDILNKLVNLTYFFQNTVFSILSTLL